MMDLNTVLADLQTALADATSIGATTVVADLNAAISDVNALLTTPSLPSWVPAPGYYADIPATNIPNDVLPSFYSKYADPIFYDWSGASYVEEYSPLGAMVYEGGGHGSTNTSGIRDGKMVFDLSTLTWSWTNGATKLWGEPGYPSTPATDWDAYGERPDGSVFSPHTYHGVQTFPKAWGGGPKGGQMRVGFAGCGVLYNTVWAADLSQPLAGNTKIAPVVTVGSGTFTTKGCYLETAIDTQRQGWWVATHMGSDRVCFVHADGTIDTYIGAGINSNGTVFTRDPTRDKLVRIDVTDTTVALHMYELDCANPTAHGWVSKPLAMDPATIADRTQLPVYMPNPNSPSTLRNYFSMCGLEWSSILGAFVQFQDGQPNATKVVSMPYVWVIQYVPATDSYMIRRETLTAAPGTGPTSYAITTNGAPVYNGTFNKFREVPAARCFVWATSGTQKPQAFRLMGM